MNLTGGRIHRTADGLKSGRPGGALRKKIPLSGREQPPGTCTDVISGGHDVPLMAAFFCTVILSKSIQHVVG